MQTGQASEVDRTARAIYEELEKSPAALNTLRGSKFLVDAGFIGATVVTLGHNILLDCVMVPLVASVTQWLVEFMGKQYVDGQREQTRQRMQLLMVQTLSAPLAEWLVLARHRRLVLRALATRPPPHPGQRAAHRFPAASQTAGGVNLRPGQRDEEWLEYRL